MLYLEQTITVTTEHDDRHFPIRLRFAEVTLGMTRHEALDVAQALLRESLAASERKDGE